MTEQWLWFEMFCESASLHVATAAQKTLVMCLSLHVPLVLDVVLHHGEFVGELFRLLRAAWMRK